MADESTSNGQDKPYVLYHNLYSICSIMVRYTLAVKGAPQKPAAAMVVKEQEVDIFHGAQLDEQFLLEINPRGQVPVLANAGVLPSPIADSLAITMYIASRYPSLLPAHRKEEICRLLHDLHAVNYFSLSFAGKPQVPASAKDAIIKQIEDPATSQRYRDALVYKLTIFEKDKIGGIVPAEVETNNEKARKLLLELDRLVVPSAGPWLWGETIPTALDAHLIVFLARLRDLGKGELIPQALCQYGDMAMETVEWQRVMGGRQTMYGG